jgi:hypothetical protein
MDACCVPPSSTYVRSHLLSAFCRELGIHLCPSRVLLHVRWGHGNVIKMQSYTYHPQYHTTGQYAQQQRGPSMLRVLRSLVFVAGGARHGGGVVRHARTRKWTKWWSGETWRKETRRGAEAETDGDGARHVAHSVGPFVVGRNQTRLGPVLGPAPRARSGWIEPGCLPWPMRCVHPGPPSFWLLPPCGPCLSSSSTRMSSTSTPRPLDRSLSPFSMIAACFKQ